LAFVLSLPCDGASIEFFPRSDPKIVMTPGAFSGKWTYRSYRNDPNISVDPNNLLFGRAEIEISESPDGQVNGTLGGQDWSLELKGIATYTTAGASIKFQGVGEVGGETWVYDYFGYLSPMWSTGLNQRRAILGSVIRTTPHSGGSAAAGYVASFLAVRH
jgi:hypothetical protein